MNSNRHGPSLQQRWLRKETLTSPRCHSCKVELKGPHFKVGSLARCFWCNKRMGGG